MYFTIETNGSSSQYIIAEHIKDYLESNFGYTIDYSVGLESSPISVFNDNNDLVASFDKQPDDAVLDFYFSIMDED